MVEKVEAFKDSSGHLWHSETAAKEAEARIQLKNILGQNADVCVTAIMNNSTRIFNALSPLELGIDLEKK